MLPILLFLVFAIQELPSEYDLPSEQKLVTAPEKSLQSICASFESRLLMSLEANNSLFEELELSPRQQRKILLLRSEALANEESQETLRAKILNEALINLPPVSTSTQVPGRVVHPRDEKPAGADEGDGRSQYVIPLRIIAQ